MEAGLEGRNGEESRPVMKDGRTIAMRDRINIKTIAEKAGVSVATVSRVINQNGRFSAETEAMVRRVMEEMDYHPNTIAKSLRENHSHIIGVIVPDIMNAHFAGLVLEIEKNLFRHAYSTVICNTNESDALERKHIDTLLSQRVSGIVFISGKRHYSLDDVTVVYVDRRPDNYEIDDDCVVIESDNESGGYLAARCLIDKGCRDITMLYAHNMDHNQKMRIAGYERALREQALAAKTICVDTITAVAAAEKIKEHIRAGCRPDGLVCTTDILAIGAMIGLRELGICVPQEVKVTGYDDSMLAALYNPAITSVRQSIEDMAQKTVDSLLERIDGGGKERARHVLPVHLVERETTK